MKALLLRRCLLGGCLLLAAAAHAASPTDAEPAVTTSPAAAPSDVQSPQGRGNPRRLELQADPAMPADPATPAAPADTARADTAPASAPRTAQPQPRGSNDRIELDVTQITGNAELPKVMYVVPWKRPELGDLNGRPAKSLLDEVLAPVDRDVFRRQNRYYDALQPDAARAAPAGEK